jgi:hypothetical protein
MAGLLIPRFGRFKPIFMLTKNYIVEVPGDCGAEFSFTAVDDLVVLNLVLADNSVYEVHLPLAEARELILAAECALVDAREFAEKGGSHE